MTVSPLSPFKRVPASTSYSSVRLRHFSLVRPEGSKPHSEPANLSLGFTQDPFGEQLNSALILKYKKQHF
jgi:hypothetical protein